VLSNSILLGFPYADVEEMGSAILVVTNKSRGLAEKRADALALHLWDLRNWLGGRYGMDNALRYVSDMLGPICLLDMGDNAGGGSPADSTHLAHAIRRHGIRPAFICLNDPAAVQAAEQSGPGSRLTIAVGGKTDRLHGEPFEDQFTVLGLYDGKFTEPEPRHGGFTNCDQGPTAVLRGDSGITVMLTSRRMPPFSLRQLTTFGVDPAAFHVVVAKGVNAPVAAYQPVCRQLMQVDTPGCTTADMTKLEFRHRRRPMFPFERETVWKEPKDKKNL
jgi:microcystin degradation protein MlrC